MTKYTWVWRLGVVVAGSRRPVLDQHYQLSDRQLVEMGTYQYLNRQARVLPWLPETEFFDFKAVQARSFFRLNVGMHLSVLSRSESIWVLPNNVTVRDVAQHLAVQVRKLAVIISRWQRHFQSASDFRHPSAKMLRHIRPITQVQDAYLVIADLERAAPHLSPGAQKIAAELRRRLVAQLKAIDAHLNDWLTPAFLVIPSPLKRYPVGARDTVTTYAESVWKPPYRHGAQLTAWQKFLARAEYRKQHHRLLFDPRAEARYLARPIRWHEEHPAPFVRYGLIKEEKDE